MSIALCGLLVAEILFKLDIIQTNFALIFFTSIFFALILNLISNYTTTLMTGGKIIEHLNHFGYTLLPLTLFGYISLKLIEVFGDVKGSLMLFKIYKFNFDFTNVTQILLVGIGLFNNRISYLQSYPEQN